MRSKKGENHEMLVLMLVLGIVFLFFNFFMPTFKGDDLAYLNRLNKIGYTSASLDHYKTWSSRILIELILMFTAKHFTLWRLLNTAVMLGTITLLCKYIYNRIEAKKLLLVFAIYTMIPLTVMGETGWVATTTNYQWPVFFSMLAFYPFYQCLKNETINLSVYYCSIPLFFLGSNQEQVNVCFFVLTLFVSIYLWNCKKYNLKLIVFSVISFIGLIFSLTAPGNSARASKEIINWLPEFKDFTIVNKLDLGISSFGKPFFFDFNGLFLILFLLIFFLSYTKSKNYYIRIIAAIPLFLNIITYIGNMAKQGFINYGGNSRVMIWGSENLDKLFSKTGTNLSLFNSSTWIATFLVMGLLGCLIVGIYVSFTEKKVATFGMLLLLMGFCSRVIMGFSPTVWASGVRTFYIMYMVAAILVLMLLKELSKSLKINKMEFVQFSISTIGICTFILTVLNRE